MEIIDVAMEAHAARAMARRAMRWAVAGLVVALVALMMAVAKANIC